MDAAADRLPGARRAVEEGISEGLHRGAQLYVSRQGEQLADWAVGEDRPGVPLTRGHLMLWLSSSKPVAAVAIAQLWERGLLELDDPVARHVPEFAAGGKEGITLRHVLTHTAGIRSMDVPWPGASWDELVARIAAMKLEPRWVPGQKAGYHLASSWFILGEVIRRLDRRPFETYVREAIFEPLGMADTWIGMPAERYRAYAAEGRIAAMYDTGTGQGREHAWGTEERVTRPNPGGNGRGPMRDLGRFYEMLLARGVLDSRRVLSAQAVEALSAPHRVGMLDHTFRHVMDWGLGVIVNSARYGADTVPYGYGHHASPRAFGHSGYRSSTGFGDPEHGLAVAVCFNGAPENDVHERRIRLVLDAVYEDLGLASRTPSGTPPAS